MRYNLFRTQGQFIGSGRGRSRMQDRRRQRAKQSGTCWSESGLLAVLHTRCCVLSRRFEAILAGLRSRSAIRGVTNQPKIPLMPLRPDSSHAPPAQSVFVSPLLFAAACECPTKKEYSGIECICICLTISLLFRIKIHSNRHGFCSFVSIAASPQHLSRHPSWPPWRHLLPPPRAGFCDRRNISIVFQERDRHIMNRNIKTLLPRPIRLGRWQTAAC